MSYIYLIHPIDENLQFLKKVIRSLSKEFPSRTSYIKLTNNKLSHEECLSKIKQSTERDLICFFCHGRTDGLLGCRFRLDYPTHRRQYDHGLLISADNIELLRNKKIFCLACNSIEVGNMAVEAGAKAFLGFDKININNCPNIHVKSLTKFFLRVAINNALLAGIQNNNTFNQLADYLKLILNKQNDNLILTHKGKKGYRKFYLTAADILHEIKEGIHVCGDGTVHLND